MLQLELVMCKNHKDGTGFEGMRDNEEKLRLGTERPGKAIWEELKRYFKEVEP